MWEARGPHWEVACLLELCEGAAAAAAASGQASAVAAAVAAGG